jgi:hypothetical protein
VLVLQMLGAVAEFERSLIHERVKAGIAAAKARGRAGGSPGLRNHDPAVIANLANARRHARVNRLIPQADGFLPIVGRLRPAQSWEKVTEAVNTAMPKDRPRLTKGRLVRAVRTLVREGMAEARLLGSAPKLGRQVSPANKRAMELVSSFVSGKPSATGRDSLGWA